MSSAVLAVGASRPGILSRVANSLPDIGAIRDPGAALGDVENAVFDRFDTAVENKMGIGTTSSDLTMSLPRMAWRVLAGAGIVGAAVALL